MYCRNCGKELNENAMFCDQCGAKVSVDENEVVELTKQMEEVIEEPKGPWKVFAIVGYVLGIVNLVLVLLPFYSLIMSVYGIVLSALGKKSIVKRRQ